MSDGPAEAGGACCWYAMYAVGGAGCIESGYPEGAGKAYEGPATVGAATNITGCCWGGRGTAYAGGGGGGAAPVLLL